MEAKLSLFVVAYKLKYNCYHSFRLVDDVTGEVKDVSAFDLLRSMTRGQNKVTVQHLKVDYDRDSFKFIGCDESRLCILGDNNEPRVNADGLVITKIIGDNAYAANYKGQIITVHQLRIVNNVKKGNYVLTNADILPNNRISIRPTK